MLRIEPGAAGSGSKYANHCAMLPPNHILLFKDILGVWQLREDLPGGKLEHPVVNCKKAFLSAAVKLTSTLTNLTKAEESRV